MNRRLLLVLIATVAAATALFTFDRQLLTPALAYTTKLGTAGVHSPHHELPELPLALVFDQARERIVSRQENGRVVAWDIESGARTVLAKTDSLFAFCSAEQILLVSDPDGLVLFDLATGGFRRVSDERYDHGAWSRDCMRLVLAADDRTAVELWDGRKLRLLASAQTSEAVRNGLAISEDGKQLAAAAGTYSPNEGHETALEIFEIADSDSLLPRVRRNDADVVLGMWTMVFAPDAGSLFVGSQIDARSGLRSIAPGTGETHWSETGFRSYWVRALAISPSGDLLVSGDEKGRLRFWDANSGALHFERDTGLVVQALAFSPDGKWLAVALKDSTIRIVELKSLGS